MARRIIRDNASLAAEYDTLSSGDIVVGRLRLAPGEEHVLLDLVSRGVELVPSPTAQLCSRSKVFQARILTRYMVPGTSTVYNRHDILSLVSEYSRKQIRRVVCKLDRANGGQGILLFGSMEEVYTSAVLETLRYPFVVQPFIEGCRDIRAVILGEKTDTYTRHNPDNFRHNLHCGGSSSSFELSAAQGDLCREIMDRAGFPYACVDLLSDPAGNTWLSEINLRGGLRGSSLTQQDYLAAIEKIHAERVSSLLEGSG